MPGTIWNEGRVVGFSAWELYCRQVALTDASATPADEKAWLASTLTYGASMLLWVAPDNISGAHYRDFQFPSTSRLGAANTIMASCFIGEGGDIDSVGWATKVVSYGNLITNTSESSPSGEVDDTGTIPVTDNGALSDEAITQIYDYVKIADGVIIQPGTWVAAEATPPAKDFIPTLITKPRLRLSFTDTVTNGFWLLLTGFTDRSILFGESVQGHSTSTSNPENGDFLGPSVFPWAAKVLFSMPLAITTQISAAQFSRKLPATGTEKSVVNAAVIDFESANPVSYYNTRFSDSAVDVDITQAFSIRGGINTLTAYQVDPILPPALFGATYASGAEGADIIGPIDIVAPGTTKIYSSTPLDGQQLAEKLEAGAPNTIGMYRDSDLILYEINQTADIDSAGRYVPVSEDQTEDIAALYMYNTQNLWFYSMHADTTAPTVDDLKDVKGIQGIRVIKGHVSDKFIDDFCVDYATAIAACQAGRIGTGHRSYIDQLVAKYGQAYVEQHYKFFFHSFYSPVLDSEGKNAMFFPVNVDNNSLSFGTKFLSELNADHGFNFSGSSITIGGVTVASSNSDYLGGFYNQGSYSSTSVSQMCADGVTYVYQDHPVLHNVIRDYDTMWQPYTGVPKAPVAYDAQFVPWFFNTAVADVADATALEAMGIHSDYRNLDFQSFIQYAATGRDMTISKAEAESTTTYTTQYTYFFKAEDITEIATTVDFDWEGHSYTAKVYVEALMSQVEFYKMAEIHLYDFTLNDSSVVLGPDVTKDYTDRSYHNWVASGYSGTHTTKAVSLVNAEGNPLPTGGTAGKISAENINWIDLLDALNLNKSIDVLGDVLKGLKSNITSSGTNYLELANGLRFYISSAAPQDADIPNGSVGLGWGSGVHIYTSGSWS